MKKLLLHELQKFREIYILYFLFIFFQVILLATLKSVNQKIEIHPEVAAFTDPMNLLFPLVSIDIFILMVMLSSLIYCFVQILLIRREKFTLFVTFHFGRSKLLMSKWLLPIILYLINVFFLYLILQDNETILNVDTSQQEPFTIIMFMTLIYFFALLPMSLYTLNYFITHHSQVEFVSIKPLIPLYLTLFYLVIGVIAYGFVDVMYYSDWKNAIILMYMGVFISIQIVTTKIFNRYEGA